MLAHTTFTSVMTLLTVAPTLARSHPELADRIYRHVELARRRDIRITECITDAKGDRSLAPQAGRSGRLRARGRPPPGRRGHPRRQAAHHRGLGHDLIVMPTKKMKPGEEDYAIACAVPVDSPGVTIINTTYAPLGEATATTRSAAQQLPDSLVIFDDVFVPTERVFLDGQSITPRCSRTRWACGSASAAWPSWPSTADELVAWPADRRGQRAGPGLARPREDRRDDDPRDALRGGLEAALVTRTRRRTATTTRTTCSPTLAKYHGAANFNTMVRHLHDIAGGAVVTAPSIADFENPELRPLLRST